ncbi:MAG: phosphate ABC transporter substrate-binding protein [Nanoarchaeota archaeon]|nr:phosphate ABC transporter substrate-binding protein [Nanoarchaeota archaeon]
MKFDHGLYRAFGIDEYGFEDIPNKISNVFISRIENRRKTTCTYCFPHGIETINSHYNNYQKNWKRHRKVQYK